jgi:hypothetical protein
MSNWINEMYNIELWKKYSQHCEEAYLTHILKNIKVKNKHVVDLGAWDGFHFSNSRHFIENGYTASLIDGDNRGNKEVHQEFITKENIGSILSILNTPATFDLLSIDLDGNDFYILDQILKAYNPSVIIAEFNPIFALNEPYAIKYNPNHTWQNDDYYGFSFSAGIKLAEKYDYTCIFQNVSLNMYFVCNKVLAESLGVDMEDLKNHIPPVTYKVEQYHPKSNRTDWELIS